MSNFDFVPKSIDAAAIQLGEGTTVRISSAIIQRTTALRAYSSYAAAGNWMEKLSTAYIVAIATRSADSWLMQDIQNHIPEEPRISCPKCREATIGLHVIRGRLFPRLGQLRKHANKLIHHLDKPENRGVDGLNILGVFDYCYHLFQENTDALFRHIPSATFPLALCKSCKAVRAL
ncbi:MAG: hypothetical protein NT159_21120 [Proteobacteria bacterium]|nr:hypothetical protein [Pseudomonadota bacterium]